MGRRPEEKVQSQPTEPGVPSSGARRSDLHCVEGLHRAARGAGSLLPTRGQWLEGRAGHCDHQTGEREGLLRRTHGADSSEPVDPNLVSVRPPRCCPAHTSAGSHAVHAEDRISPRLLLVCAWTTSDGATDSIRHREWHGGPGLPRRQHDLESRLGSATPASLSPRALRALCPRSLRLLDPLRDPGTRETDSRRHTACALASGQAVTAGKATAAMVPVYPTSTQFWRLPSWRAKWRGRVPLRAPGAARAVERKRGGGGERGGVGGC